MSETTDTEIVKSIDAAAVESIAHEVREKLGVPGIVLLVIKPDSAMAGISLIEGVNVANVAKAVKGIFDQMEQKYLADHAQEG